jgi:hypothetical protein
MNRLSTEKQMQVIAALVEGTSINETCRMAGVAMHTILNLLRDLGCAAAAYHQRNVKGFRVRPLQCDEIWSFVGAKRRNVSPEQQAEGCGDVWTWTAIDADTKLCVSYLMGGGVSLPRWSSCWIALLALSRDRKSQQMPTAPSFRRSRGSIRNRCRLCHAS